MSTVYLVVGASRGIGQELVNQLSAKPDTKVIATVRKPVNFGKPTVEFLILDQTDSASVKAAAVKVKAIDVLILNAAIGEDEKLLATSEERLTQYLNTNVVGNHRVVEAFLPALRAGKTRKIIFISSMSGSLKEQIGAEFGFSGPYSVTKAANNMQAVQYHNELHKEGFTIIPIHPGWVATDMGLSANSEGVPEGIKPLQPSESVKGLIKVIDGLKQSDSATFYQHDGSNLPW